MDKIGSKYPKLTELAKFKESLAFKTPDLKIRLNGPLFDKAYFMTQHALYVGYRYIVTINNLFRRVGHKNTTVINQNISRVAQLIDEAKSHNLVPNMIITDFNLSEIECLSEVYGMLDKKFPIVKLEHSKALGDIYV